MNGKQNKKSKRQTRRTVRRRAIPSARAFSIKPSNTGQEKSRMVREEVVLELNATSTFDVIEIPINPGIPASFPWLSQQSGGWEYFRFESFSAIYEPTLGTTHDGAVYMAFEYSPGSAPPPDVKAIMAYKGAVSGSIWATHRCDLDVSSAFPQGGWKYVRHNLVPNERKLYDAAVLMIVVRKPTASNNAGLLRFKYSMWFKTPQVEKPLAITDGFYLGRKLSPDTIVDGADLTAAGDYTESTIFTTGDSKYQSDEGIVRVNLTNSGNALVLQPGTYSVSAVVPLLSDLLGATSYIYDMLLSIGITADDGMTFTNVADQPIAQVSAIADGTPHTRTLGLNTTLFVEEEAVYALNLTASVPATVVSGTIVALSGFSWLLRRLGSGSNFIASSVV